LNEGATLPNYLLTYFSGQVGVLFWFVRPG